MLAGESEQHRSWERKWYRRKKIIYDRDVGELWSLDSVSRIRSRYSVATINNSTQHSLPLRNQYSIGNSLSSPHHVASRLRGFWVSHVATLAPPLLSLSAKTQLVNYRRSKMWMANLGRCKKFYVRSRVNEFYFCSAHIFALRWLTVTTFSVLVWYVVTQLVCWF